MAKNLKAKVTKAEMMERMEGLETKLFDLVPEGEEKTARATMLDKVSEIVSGNVKATVAEMQKLFNEGSNLLAVEAEVKKAEKKNAKAKKSKSEKPETEVKKPVSKKKKKEEVEEEEEPDFTFPETLETEEDGDYEKVDIKKLADIEEGDLVACQWTKEQLKAFTYDDTGRLKAPKSFDKDIDVLVVIDVVEDNLMYALSLGTHKMYRFHEEDVKDMDCEGMPWAVYKPQA